MVVCVCDAIRDAVCEAISDVSHSGNPRRVVMRRHVLALLRSLLWDSVHRRLSSEVHNRLNQVQYLNVHLCYMKSQTVLDPFPIP